MMPRDMAGSFTVEGGTGKIIRMCEVGEFLEIYKIDKTFRVKTPNGLDPEKINPNMPWVVSDYSEYGCQHPVVARILLQSADILNSAVFDKDIKKENIISVLSDSRDLILNCESIALELGRKMGEIEENLQNCQLNSDTLERYYNPFPQVKGLNDLGTRFLISAKRCVQNYAALIDHFYGTGIRRPRYDDIQKWAKRELGENSYIYQLAKENESKILRILNLRNFQEHPNDDKKTEIINYELLPELSIKQPVWFVTGEAPKFILNEMHEITSYIFTLGEQIFLYSISENLNENYPLMVCKEDESRVDPDCPIAYKLRVVI